MEKNSAKISLGTAVCMFVILLLIIALAVVYYLGFIKDSDFVGDKEEIQENNILKEEIKEELEIEKGEQSVVPTSDLVVSNSDIYAYIEDGILYYTEDVTGGNVSKDKMTKNTQLNNIKRMKVYNIGTAINPVLFLITEDGQVYTMRYYFSHQIEKYEGLKNYKVEDILSHTGEMYSVFEIMVKDGTTKTVEVHDNGEVVERTKNNENEFTMVYDALYKSLTEIKNNPKKLFNSNNKIEEVAILGIEINNYKYLYGEKWVSSEYPDVYNDDNLIIGTCKYGLKLDTLEGLSVAGSGDSKNIGNWFVDNKIFVYNKTTQEIELATGL